MCTAKCYIVSFCGRLWGGGGDYRLYETVYHKEAVNMMGHHEKQDVSIVYSQEQVVSTWHWLTHCGSNDIYGYPPSDFTATNLRAKKTSPVAFTRFVVTCIFTLVREPVTELNCCVKLVALIFRISALAETWHARSARSCPRGRGNVDTSLPWTLGWCVILRKKVIECAIITCTLKPSGFIYLNKLLAFYSAEYINAKLSKCLSYLDAWRAWYFSSLDRIVAKRVIYATFQFWIENFPHRTCPSGSISMVTPSVCTMIDCEQQCILLLHNLYSLFARQQEDHTGYPGRASSKPAWCNFFMPWMGWGVGMMVQLVPTSSCLSVCRCSCCMQGS